MRTYFQNIHLNYEYIHQDMANSHTVILFLHEALGSIRQWKDFPEKLCETLNLPGLVYERQGHGKSAPLMQKRTSNYLHQYALEELPAFLDSINERRKLLLVGHSDGGTIALLFASKFPDRVAGICTMAAHVINETETIAGIEPAVKAYELGKLNGLKKYHGDKTKALFFAWADIWRDPSFQNWNICDEIGKCEAPALFIQGADDQYGTAKQITLIEANYSGTSTSELISNCGHHPHLEQPENVIHLIRCQFDLIKDN